MMSLRNLFSKIGCQILNDYFRIPPSIPSVLRRINNLAFMGFLKLSFWGLNGELFLMAFVTLLPGGAMQAWISLKEGYWVVRSADFFENGL